MKTILLATAAALGLATAAPAAAQSVSVQLQYGTPTYQYYNNHNRRVYGYDRYRTYRPYQYQQQYRGQIFMDQMGVYRCIKPYTGQIGTVVDQYWRPVTRYNMYRYGTYNTYLRCV